MNTPQTDTPHPQAPYFGEPWHNEEGDFEIYRQTQNDAVEIARLRSAICLRPIAEAGPVPEGMIRIFMSWSSVEGYVIDHIYKATYAIDIYPPQQ